MYVIEVRNKETGEWDTELEGNCDSRRKYLKTHAEAVKKLLFIRDNGSAGKWNKHVWRIVFYRFKPCGD